MRSLVCLAPLLAIAAAPLPSGDCGPVPPTVTDATDRPAIHSLGSEPGAHQEIAVDRRIGQCKVPIVVREDVGGISPPVANTPARQAQTSSTSRW